MSSIRFSGILFILFSLTGCFINSTFTKLNNEISENSSTELIRLIVPEAIEITEGDQTTISYSLGPASNKSDIFTYYMSSVSANPGSNYTATEGSIEFLGNSISGQLSITTKEIGFTDSTSKDFYVVFVDSSKKVIASTLVKIKPKSQFKSLAQLQPIMPDELYYIDTGTFVLFSKWTESNGAELWGAPDFNSTPTLIADLCPGQCSSMPRDFVKVGSSVYFVAKDSSASDRYSIFKSDGTTNGTFKIFNLTQITDSSFPTTEQLVSVKTCSDILPEICGGQQRYLVANSSRIFFATRSEDSPSYQNRIYSSQGTISTTFALGASDDYPYELQIFNERILVSREDEVLVWNGSANGGETILRPSPGYMCGGHLYGSKQIAGYLYSICFDWNGFTYKLLRLNSSFAFNSVAVGSISNLFDKGLPPYFYYTSGTSLRRSDGTSVVNIYSGTSLPSTLGVLGPNTLFSDGTSLYSYDGTTPVLVATLSSSLFSGLGTINGNFYFSSGGALWKTNLTTTSQVLSLDGESFSNVALLKNSSNGIYFRALTAARGKELWRINNSAALELITETKTGIASSNPGQIVTSFSGVEYFTTVDSLGSALKKVEINPTVSATPPISGWGPGVGESVYSIFSSGDKLYWTQSSEAFDNTIRSYSISSETVSNVTNIDRSSTARSLFVGGNSTMALLEGDYPFFGTPSSSGIFVSLLNGNLGTMSSPGNYPISSSGTLALTNGTVYVGRASGQYSNVEPYFIDSTGTTTLLADIVSGSGGSYPTLLGVINNYAFFVAGVSGSRALYKTDGTPNGTQLVINSNFQTEQTPVKLNGLIFFAASTSAEGKELWVTDGTASGTKIVKDIYPGSTGSISSSIKGAVLGNSLVFPADDGSNGLELWISDGTNAGTRMIKDLCTGSCSSTLSAFSSLSNIVYFWDYVDNPNSTNQTLSRLWRTDGTSNGTFVVKDIRPLYISGAVSNNLSQIFVVNSKNVDASFPSLWRFKPSVNPEPAMIPGYMGKNPIIMGQYLDSFVVKDTNSSFRSFLYLAR